MKQVLFDRSGAVHVEEVPAPLVAPGTVLIRVAHSVISTGTEMAIYGRGGVVTEVSSNPSVVGKVMDRVRTAGVRGALEQVRERLNERTGRGYSGSGVVLEVGEGVGDLRPGDRVAYGGEFHAEIVCAPRNLVAKVPDGARLDHAAITTIGSIALHGLRLAGVGLGDVVVVVGLGIVGQLTVALARAMGCRVAGGDLRDDRIALARTLGLELAVDPTDPDGAERSVRAWTGGVGADAALVCAASSSSEPTRLGMRLARDRGAVILVGAAGLELEREPLFRKELEFRISRSYGPGRYDPAYEDAGIDYPVGYVRWTENRNFIAFLQALASGAIDVSPLLVRRFPIAAAAEAYAELGRGGDAPLTALLDYAPETAPEAPPIRTVLRRPATAAAGTLRIGLVGCGSFARSMIVPALRAQSGVKIAAVAAATGVSASNVARLVDADYATTEYEKILADPTIDAVVISTRHDLHHPMALAAARAGKPFHVEKPLAITTAQSREIVDAVAAAGVPAVVGFNRRSAPFVQALRGWMEGRTGPAQILIRVNAGALPPGHWAVDPREGGGRLVGEGCHFIDLAAFVAGAPGRVVGATVVPAARGEDPEGSTTLLIAYPDGSRATVVYGSAGHRALPKERIEVSWAGRSVVIDDFVRLEAHGVGSARKLRAADKGVGAHFANFVAVLRGPAAATAPVQAGLDVAERIDEARALFARAEVLA